MVHRAPEPDPVASLIAAARGDTRTVHLRLSGFDWAPYENSGRARRPMTQRASAIDTTLARTRSNAKPAALHATGLAELLAGHPRAALATLSTAAEKSNSSRAWSDLAATWYETAEQFGAPELLTDALAAADRALVVDPASAEARFNRAAILERLGLRDDARLAWERYLTHETNANWAAEGRTRLRSVQAAPTFLETLDRNRNPSTAIALARRDPQGARMCGTVDILARWASASRDGRADEATRHLSLARILGTTLGATNGDHLLERAVAAIDAAEVGARTTLAVAHMDYAAGRTAYRENRPVDAEALLHRAAAAFQRGGSPLAFAARQHAAIMMYEQSRDAEALREQESLVREVPPDFPSIREHARWQVGVIHASAARWGQALPPLAQSAEAFTRLGELDHASRVHRVIAIVYDRTGDTATAWKHRMIALRGIGVRSDLALEKAVATIAQAAIFARKWDVASSLLNLEIDIAHRISDDVQLADALLYRAIVCERRHDIASARRDATEAEETIARISDPAYRAYLHADALVVRARLESSPATAAALLSEAIEFLQTKGDGMEIPSLYLQRARVARKRGDVARALDDLKQGIGILETSRESLPPGEARWGAFHSDDELFEEAVDLRIEQNDPAGALAFAERARARALLDAYGGKPTFDFHDLSAEAIVVELVALPSRLVLITATLQGLQAISVEIDRRQLASDIAAFTHALRINDTTATRTASMRLYQRLIAPISDELTNETTIVFVPDATTAAIPFSALANARGEYLLEQHTVLVAPSASAFVSASKHHRRQRPQSVLIVSNAQAGTAAPRLSFVNAESAAITRSYATTTEIRDAAEWNDAAADVIHFAGHAIGDDRGLEPASILLRDRRMGVAEIARLKLQRTSVVVLAGCSTARGEQRSAEGVISVAHGFLIAGVPSVIATLWQIDDEAAATFFPRLHRYLASGLNAAEALRSTQIESIRRGDVPASLWASLQNIGS